MAFLGFLQVTARACSTSLPVPGLDGYGALEPHLSPQTQRMLEPAKRWAFFVLLSVCSPRRSTAGSSTGVLVLRRCPGCPASRSGAGDRTLTTVLVRLVLSGNLATYASLRIDCRHGCRTRPQPCRHRVSAAMLIAAAILTAFFVLELTTGAGDQLDRAALRRRAHAHRSGRDVHGADRGPAGPPAAARHRHATYGWHRAEVFTAVANAVLLLGVAAFILYEAVERLGDAPEVPGVPMIVVALAGLVANAVVVLLLRSALREQPRRQGRLHGGRRRHGRQHRRADRRHRHRHDAVALRRRGGRGARRAVGAAPRHLAGPGRAADPVGVVAEPTSTSTNCARRCAPSTA